MHYEALLVVLLANPIPIGDEPTSHKKQGKRQMDKALGYTVVYGVNASSLLEAATMVCNETNRSKDSQADVIEQLEIKHIQKDDWDPEVIPQFTDVDNLGIYYRSNRAYFSEL